MRGIVMVGATAAAAGALALAPRARGTTWTEWFARIFRSWAGVPSGPLGYIHSHWTMPRMHGPMYAVMAEALDLRPEDELLEIACGSGVFLARHATMASYIAGLDLSDLQVDLAPTLLWPPNHRMVAIDVSVSASDACGPAAVSLAAVVSNEPGDAPGGGDGRTEGDIQDVTPGIADTHFLLRAERSGGGSGRVYTVHYTATDGSGLESEQIRTVTVPTSRNGVTDPLAIQVTPAEAGTLVSWPPVPEAVRYHVIRGSMQALHQKAFALHLGKVTCVAGSLEALDTVGHEDVQDPGPGEAFFYLVEYENDARSGYGSAAAPLPRIPQAGDCRP